MKALLKIEWISTVRNWQVFILSIGLPVFFFLLYSGMTMSDNPVEQKLFIKGYMLTMTAFSMSSFGFFSFPAMLKSDKNDHYLTYIEHSPLSMSYYYLAKVLRVLVYFLIAILVTFTVGFFFRQVSMPVRSWFLSVVLLLLSGLVFLAFGLLFSQIKSQQLMTVLANITFLGLAILGGSWMPISVFPDWVQAISKLTPTYHVNHLVKAFALDNVFAWQSFVIVLIYAIIVAGLALFIKERREING
ncbi:ABC transporter permease [Streptococcus saliviloxodontae]|uniref:ABC-2 type transport system permease protein n=1 Tax=Streptococcus saliviloxodontae TaxID=1349416 RepID=A0ABS2PJ30_9STRE|nr:ABC transporter permease [Streptococcus saliviloxodontae]MBM7635437.1 ABC-2 type transport system permease protein [Streptococcus saliviloxodontae]